MISMIAVVFVTGLTFDTIESVFDSSEQADVTSEVSSVVSDLNDACDGVPKTSTLDLGKEREGAYIEVCSDSNSELCYKSRQNDEENRVRVEECDSIEIKKCGNGRLQGSLTYSARASDGDAKIHCLGDQ